MNNHMRVFLQLTMYRKVFGERSKNVTHETIADIMGFYVPMKDYDRILQFQPKAKQLVSTLFSMGFSPTFIAEYMGISKATVSYHLHSEVIPEYINPYLRTLEQEHKNSEVKSDW